MTRPPLPRGADPSLLKSYICRRCILNNTRNARSRTFQTSARQRKAQNEADAEWQSRAQEVASGQRKSMLTVLEERGFIKDIAGSRSSLEKLLNNKRTAAYAGIDPTAPSLHLGHLLPVMILFWLHIHGYHAISLVGGATAKVGDPSGRLSTRTDMDTDTRITNLTAMRSQVGQLWQNLVPVVAKHGYIKTPTWKSDVYDNTTWLANLPIIDFLAVLGRGARMGTMMGRDTVRNKMTKGDGMSFAEFTYPLLQAWDWWHMYKTDGVQLQIGGSDQYGNIVAGMDAIKYIKSSQSEKDETDIDPMEAPYGITTPLLTTSSGTKFGKSAGNAVWLNQNMTTPFDLYGFLLRSSDSDVKKYLCLFTFVPLPQIEQAMEQHLADPGKRVAQHLLAREVLDLVHGVGVGKATEAQHCLLRKPTFESLVSSSVTMRGNAAAPDTVGTAEETTSTPQSGINKTRLPKSLVVDTPISHILCHAGLAPTKSAANRLIQSNGAYIGVRSENDNGSELVFRPIRGLTTEFVNEVVQETGMLVLRVGKWKVTVVQVVNDSS
ncbi:hypothetical protein AAFC00_002423 [Neodothiora populina]|uniref:Tyrosine--tRNA ligase n=1 Tax=Neodothiora populina TaxID=2781224 RepID=A0ABR3P720_9PEZI